MKILVANHWLKKLGGSETFTYTLIGELVKRGHELSFFTLQPGLVSDRIIRDFGIAMHLKGNYDLVLANHHTMVDLINGRGPIIQTCHGVYPKLEQPSKHACAYVAISEEVQRYLARFGYKATLIYNGIDCERFFPKSPTGKLKNVLSLSHSADANWKLATACNSLGVRFKALNKYKNPVWEVEDYINEADLVVTLGRGAYESFACGRPVIVYDGRPYQQMFGDGYIDGTNLDESLKYNCSGRRYKKHYDVLGLFQQLKYYRRGDGEELRKIALEKFNIKTAVDQYLELAEKL